MKPTTPRLNPRKLLHSKWTAVAPAGKQKHFMVTRVLEPEPPLTGIEFVEIEAVHSRRTRILPWRELKDQTLWRQGWVG